MNESENKIYRQTAVEAVFGILFIFAILIFLLYKFGNNNQSVENINGDISSSTTTKEEFAQAMDDAGGANELYFKYIKKIYDEQSVNGKNANVDQIVSDYKDELQNSVKLPEQTVTIPNISGTYNKDTYNTEFENVFQNLRKAGGTTESKIFSQQIVDKDTLIPLSDYDKETLLRLATEYEIFANKISSLNTPNTYEKRATSAVKDSLNVAYILRQMTNTTDTKKYSLWITKYSEVMFDIIANRYAK